MVNWNNHNYLKIPFYIQVRQTPELDFIQALNIGLLIHRHQKWPRYGDKIKK